MCVSGCATVVENTHAPDLVGRIDDYPVQIVALRFVPPSDIDPAVSQHKLALEGYLPVAVETRSTGKTDAALKYAGMGALECGIRSLGAGVYFPFIFVPCAVLAMPVMAVVGAIEAAPEATVDAVRAFAADNLPGAAHAVLVELARAYLAGVSGRQVEVVEDPKVIAGKGTGDRPDYSPRPDAAGTILELGLLEIRLAGSGKGDEPLCLHMAARGRKFDIATGKLMHELGHARMIECHPSSEWLTEEHLLLATALERGQRILAEQLVDELYLVYRPVAQQQESGSKHRVVPLYVLAPHEPPAPEVYLDLRSITGKPRHVQGWGGLHFVDIDSLVPTLRWEGFPRAFDGVTDFSDITYDLRLYSGEVVPAGVAEPAVLLHEARGLVEPTYAVATPLKPCSRYFWTVRAGFTLNGLRRVTEWAGAYDTAGGEVSPSYRYFYPFRTAAAHNGPDC
ncbi:MAG: hypothetical protein KDI88_12015 [Gammaproteobacteria bacterium]|nr:hypothetical protein [Gammaproteobacteria bacterium]